MTIPMLEWALSVIAVAAVSLTLSCLVGSVHRLLVFRRDGTNGARLILASGNLYRDLVRVGAAVCLAATAVLLLTQPDNSGTVALIAQHGLLGLGLSLLVSALVDVRMRAQIAHKLAEELVATGTEQV